MWALVVALFALLATGCGARDHYGAWSEPAPTAAPGTVIVVVDPSGAQ